MPHAVVYIIADGIVVVVGIAVSVAYSERIERPDAWVDVITNPVAVCICRTGATTGSDGIQLVSVAIAVSRWDIGASAFVDCTWTVADVAGIILPYAIIHIITYAIGVCIGCAGATALTQSVIDIAIAVTVAGGYVGAPTGINFSGAIANSAGIIGSDARVILVAYLVRISIVQAVSVTVEPVCGVCATSIGIRGARGAEFGDEELSVCAIGFAVGAGSEIREILSRYLYIDISIGGELCDEHLAIGIRNTLVISVIVDVPKSADEVVHDQIIARFKIGNPVLVRTCNGADGSLWCPVFRRMANGYPTVVEEVGKEVQ